MFDNRTHNGLMSGVFMAGGLFASIWWMIRVVG